MAMGAEHRRVVRQETAINVVINAVVPPAVIWFLNVSPPQTVLGRLPLLAAVLPAAGIATFMMTLCLTPIIRKRVQRGALPAIPHAGPKRDELNWVPRNLLLRSLALALLAVVLLVPAGLLAAAVLHILPFDKLGSLAFNVAFGAVVGLVMAPFVVIPALQD